MCQIFYKKIANFRIEIIDFYKFLCFSEKEFLISKRILNTGLFSEIYFHHNEFNKLRLNMYELKFLIEIIRFLNDFNFLNNANYFECERKIKALENMMDDICSEI